MSEKIYSEREIDKIFDAIGVSDSYRMVNKAKLRAAGLLEQEEDLLDKARDAAWHVHPAGALVHNAQVCTLENCKEKERLYEAAITRLKASAWTEGDARWYGDYCWQQGRKYNSDIQTPSEWLAQRKAGKGDGTT